MNILFKHTLALVAAAVISPALFGIIARSFFFRRDADDVRNFHGMDSAQPIEVEFPATPEPEPLRREPWPRFPSSVPPGNQA
jgi:hypothetical protein